MYSGELEVQAKRKAIAVLQDEINRILHAARELSTLPKLMVSRDRAGIKDARAGMRDVIELQDAACGGPIGSNGGQSPRSSRSEERLMLSSMCRA